MESLHRSRAAWGIALAGALLAACGDGAPSDLDQRLAQYATVDLTTDTTALTRRDRVMISLLIGAAAQMDTLFWHQVYGDYPTLLADIKNPDLRRYVAINYGPWDRLRGDEPFLTGAGTKPAGANFYPRDMTKEEFETFVAAHPDQAAAFKSLYTLIRRRPDGTLYARPYREVYAERLLLAAAALRTAADLAEDEELHRYLYARADALRSDNFGESDRAWLDMKDNTIDIVIGPIETYEDQLFGYKAAYEAFVLVKDRAWSRRLARYAALLPSLQRGLPVAAAYRREMPGTEGDLNAYDVLYYAGDANAGSKTIAINLPNDEQIQLEMGTRRLQLKNAVRAKFETIMVPLAGLLIAEDQRPHVTFDAFFANTMFHEVAHGLGIKHTITGRGTVREALKAHASAIEEGKADILGLYMVARLFEQGVITEGDVRDNYVTFLASIFRSVRFGASSAHGKANMVRFHVFQELGAFSRDSVTGTYRVNVDRIPEAIRALSEQLLVLQGDGDYEGAGKLLAEKGVIGSELQADLDRLAAAGIPVDVVFRQGEGWMPRTVSVTTGR
ncbi:MAG: Zn-dependent hydrolase [Gemmatimonadetes bacterium]|nr:Zn-dependent hydrolase [Gemmatimonadota bacterium]